jgi:hypothetical protein
MAIAIWGVLMLPKFANAQWREVSTFPNEPVTISWGNPIFVSTDLNVYVSYDQGKSWETVDPPMRGVKDFARKDSLTIWAASFDQDSGCMRTVDGGKTWSVVAQGPASSLAYLPSLNRLHLSRWEHLHSLFSNDEGDTWDTLEFTDRNGFAFSDDQHGVVTQVSTSPEYFIGSTSDGGLTWNRFPHSYEIWQPAVIKGSQNYFACQDAWGVVFRSTNGGLSWDSIHFFDGEALSGTVRTDECGSVYVQTANVINLKGSGVYRSQDLGETWELLGPFSSDYDDARFALDGKNLVVTDTIDNTTRYAHVWQYVGPPLALTIEDQIEFAVCHDTLFALDYEFADFCVGAYPELLGAKITGSDKFEIDADFSPREIRSPQSIAVNYSPTGGSSDTTYLTLTFWTGNITFDTTITFIGRKPDQQQVSLGLKVSKTSVQNDEMVDIAVKADRAIANAGLNQLTFNVEYYDDLFRFVDATSPIGASIGATQRVGRKLVIPVTLRGTDLILDPAVPIVELHLAARLTDSIRTSIDLTDLQLNGGDIDYANCKLSASSTSASVAVALNCGDDLMQRVMRGEKAIAIKSINPNPTNGSITIDYDSKLSGAVTLSVYSVNGVLVHEEILGAAPSHKPIQLDASGWASGRTRSC